MNKQGGDEFGEIWVFRYIPIWEWFNLLLVNILTPRWDDIIRVWRCLVWLLEGGLSTPRYLNEDVIGSFLMLTVEKFADDIIRMVWLLLLVMMGKPYGTKAQLMQYQAHFVSSSCLSVVWRRCSQPWTTSWRLLVAVSRQLCSQSLVYCCLSSTKPMIVFFQVIY